MVNVTEIADDALRALAVAERFTPAFDGRLVKPVDLEAVVRTVDGA